MTDIQVTKEIIGYLDEHYLDTRRNTKSTLADWTICDDYSKIKENIENFKNFLIEKYNLPDFILNIHVHLKIEDLVSNILLFNKV